MPYGNNTHFILQNFEMRGPRIGQPSGGGGGGDIAGPIGIVLIFL